MPSRRVRVRWHESLSGLPREIAETSAQSKWLTCTKFVQNQSGRCVVVHAKKSLNPTKAINSSIATENVIYPGLVGSVRSTCSRLQRYITIL